MISVVIPVHNRQDTIPLTLQGLTLQSVSDFEVIVVDDRSTDETLPRVLSFMKDSTLKMKVASIYRHDAWNASRPRNYGAKLAEKETTHYLFLDSDVVLNRDAINFYQQDIAEDSNRVIIGPYHWTAPMIVSGDDIENRWDDYINNRLASKYVRGAMGIIGQDMRMNTFAEKGLGKTSTVFDGLACFGGNLLVPKPLFWKAGGYDEETLCGIEDGDFGITLWKNEAQFSYESRAVGYHAWHPIPEGRHPANFKAHLDRLNMKHFNTTDPDFGIIEHSRELYKQWGIDGWNPPPEWEK